MKIKKQDEFHPAFFMSVLCNLTSKNDRRPFLDFEQ